MIKNTAHCFSSLVVLLVFCFAYSAMTLPVQAQTSSPEVVVILPFENTSPQPEYNWVGESFADSLAELLNVPGIIAISSDERELTYQRLQLPLTTLPSRATALKIAREARATMLVIGKYDVTITPAARQGEPARATLQGTAQVIRVAEGRFMGEAIGDGRWATHQYDFGGLLSTLQTMQGRLAYQVLYQRDKALPYSQNQFVERATKAPPRAFESYVKGVMTDDATKRSAYLQNALYEFERANAGSVYKQAAFELGHVYMSQGDWRRAADNFAKLQRRDPKYPEAAFYAAISYWRLNDLTNALGALMPLASETPLTSVYNNVGAISLQAARSPKETEAEERKRLLNQAETFLNRAVESAPNDALVRFNYAYALLLNSNHKEAAEQLRSLVESNPRDGEAQFLLAKALERSGNATAAAAADNEARRYLSTYANQQTEWQNSQTLLGIPVRLYYNFSRFDFYNAKREALDKPVANADAQDLLAKARELYQAGRDDEALAELRRVLTVEPTEAEAYLLIGRINQRRGDLDASISALKTAVFWEAKQIDAHVLLGRIFFERGDRAQALAYARNAIQIDPNNQDAIALMRQVETNTR